jgi:hypothetical protein
MKTDVHSFSDSGIALFKRFNAAGCPALLSSSDVINYQFPKSG